MQRLLARCQLIYTKQHQKTIAEALEYATVKHGGQKRVSGEPYITHPIAVANILLDLGMDYSSVCAASACLRSASFFCRWLHTAFIC